MAIFGAQLVFTMVTASMLSKFSGHFSFARWILCSRLVRYLHPSVEELKTLSAVPTGKGKGGKKNVHDVRKDNRDFTVPKNLDIQLDSAPIKQIDLLPLQFYTEYQWLLDFTVSAIVVYSMTDLYYAILQPPTEFNLSIMWCILGMVFCMKILLSLVMIYFRTQDTGEMMIVVIFGFFFLIAAMGVLIVDEEILEFGLQPGYHNFSKGAKIFLEKQGIESAGPASIMTFRILIAIICSFVGACLTFPGLRLAKMHNDAIKYTGGNPFLKIMLHINIILPLFIASLWLKPIARDYLTEGGKRRGGLSLDDNTFECIRLMVSFGFVFYRFTLVWVYLQAHLNMAVERMDMLKKEAGRITCKEIQKLVTRVYYYLCVVALQYLAPLIMLLFSLFLLKTLGNYSFAPVFGIKFRERVSNSTSSHVPYYSKVDDITGLAAQFSLALSNLQGVFTPLYFKGIFSFFCWWLCASWFTTSAFGMVYYGYFTD